MDLDVLYSAYHSAQASQDIASYRLILSSTTRSDDPKARQLAAQFIPDLFPLFPEIHDDSVESMFDLCEDPEKLIRIQAVKRLPLLIKHNSKVGLRIVDVLVQLLQARDLNELETTRASLLQAIRISPSTSITLLDQSDVVVRELSFDFLKTYQSDILPVLGSQVEQEFGDAACAALEHFTIEQVDFITGLIFNLGFYQNYTKLIDGLMLWFTETGTQDLWPSFLKIANLCRNAIKKGGNPARFVEFMSENIFSLESIPDEYLILALRYTVECLKTFNEKSDLQSRITQSPLLDQLTKIRARMTTHQSMLKSQARPNVPDPALRKQISQTGFVVKLVNDIIKSSSTLHKPSNRLQKPTMNASLDLTIPCVQATNPQESSNLRPRKRKSRPHIPASKKQRKPSEPPRHPPSLYIKLPPPRSPKPSSPAQARRQIQVRGISQSDKRKRVYGEEPSVQIKRTKVKIGEQPKWNVRDNMRRRGYTLMDSYQEPV
ncbi:Apoptosis inhibitor 5 [Neolecta irregularis DAH-3]|uniref:Apoptosis inhibitor 5 n=1 Tax=Neolecta irregularis (strain DAH-3) TaxID=1198029 RepID=A0A1U7LII5_NEOID|nr:Apoptosis inhibitor 5 [Neolecta irregularis DAH-3]|eukprot:OLL22470.1 Apoptosis inhibitor 5 [Neolecta irregularis DAH-3]